MKVLVLILHLAIPALLFWLSLEAFAWVEIYYQLGEYTWGRFIAATLAVCGLIGALLGCISLIYHKDIFYEDQS